MDEKQKVPVVRFKGFTGDWERRKLGEVFKEYSEKNHPELPPLTIVQGRGTVLREDSERALQYDKSSLPSYKLVNKDDFIVHLRSFEGGLEKATTQGIISPAYHTFHGEGTDSRFYYAYFRSQKFINHDLFPYVYGIRDGRSIDIDGMKKIRLPFPSYAEQKKIGDFIDTIDGYSTLNQQKLDQLKKLKAYFLQNLFPAKGEKVPKIRFKGFTDDWEQRKLGELGEIMTDSTPSTSNSEYYSEDGIPWVTPTDINSQTISDTPRKLSEEGMKVGRVVPANTILCTCIASIGKNTLLTVKGSFNQQINCLTPNEYNDAYFLLTESVFWSNIMKRMAAAGTMQIVNKTEFSELTTTVPKIEEQKKIGQYFRALDHLITLHQRKLEALQTLKKFLLQNLFV